MRVLLTGSTGCIGSALTRRLRGGQMELMTLDRWTQGRPDRHPTFACDLMDATGVDEAVERADPDVVIHLAANASTDYALAHPVEVVRVNVTGTAALVRACQRHAPQLRAFIVASSSEIYGQQATLPSREDATPQPTTAYAVSKVAVEGLVKCSGLPYVIMRPFNTYGRANVGRGDFVVDKFVLKALRREPITVRDGSVTRDLVFRDDHVRAYEVVLADLPDAIGETFNFATGIRTSIDGLAACVADVAPLPVEVESAYNPRPDGVHDLHGDWTKARERLGWAPQWTLRAGLIKTFEEWERVLHDRRCA